MRCPRCGAENAPGAGRCSACGAELPPEETVGAEAGGSPDPGERPPGPPPTEPTRPLAPPGGPAPPTEPMHPATEPFPPPTEPLRPATQPLPPPTGPLPAPTELLPPPTEPSALRAGWGTATAWGLGTSAVLALLGQVLAFGGASLSGLDLGVGAVARIGWLYFCAFHGIGVVAEVRDLAGPVAGLLPPGFGLSYRVEVAMLTATALALVLLFRGGRAAADRAGGRGIARAVHGLKVAPAYAAPAFLLSLLVRFDLPSPVPEVLSGRITIRP
ncbi:MAG TPA: zinc ribbon domain-containing protein, partial [Actinomycetota bacterium]|nr:zinc ribbon domain-containing protein [Actinomycetota bacterium]